MLLHWSQEHKLHATHSLAKVGNTDEEINVGISCGVAAQLTQFGFVNDSFRSLDDLQSLDNLQQPCKPSDTFLTWNFQAFKSISLLWHLPVGVADFIQGSGAVSVPLSCHNIEAGVSLRYVTAHSSVDRWYPQHIITMTQTLLVPEFRGSLVSATLHNDDTDFACVVLAEYRQVSLWLIHRVTSQPRVPWTAGIRNTS
ncbi:hypothetical protein J6590_060253 [Homalodisca vitripennis]|nr:hypothetical protein J6590_060253 [Homalodisca vitripennis]